MDTHFSVSDIKVENRYAKGHDAMSLRECLALFRLEQDYGLDAKLQLTMSETRDEHEEVKK